MEKIYMVKLYTLMEKAMNITIVLIDNSNTQTKAAKMNGKGKLNLNNTR
jgi:hypothetical protein